MANIVIMPGGFHPFHAGHAALYNSIKEKYGEGSDIYVAASNNQKERPFPFEIKEKLAQLSGVQPGEFVQVKSPFVPTEITSKYDPDKDTIVFVRSEKDKNEYPKPGAVKKDGSPGYFQHIETAKKGAQPFSKVGYMDYLPVKEFAGITSATQIRDAWPKLNDDQREEFVTHIYPNLKGNDKLIKNVVKLLSKGMSLNEGLAYIDKHGKRVEYTRPDLPTDIENLVIDWFNDRDKYTRATLQSKGYKVDVDDKFDNIVITDKRGRKYTVSTDDAMSKLIQQAYAEPINEGFVDPDQSKQYWNHDAQKVGVGGQIEFPLTDTPNLNGRRQGFNEGEERSDIETAAYEWLLDYKSKNPEADYEKLYSVLKNVSHDDLGTQELDYFIGEPLGLNMDNKNLIVDAVLAQMTEGVRRYRYEESIEKIRNMIKESSDEQKSKSADLHRKLFELMEEEKNNVVKLRGFGKESDKKVVDIQKVRQEKEREQEKRNDAYDKKRKNQEHMMHVIQQILFGLHEELGDMIQLGIAPIEFIDFQKEVEDMIDQTEKFDANDFPFYDDDGNLLESLHVKTLQLKEYFGGWRDRQAPRTLRKQSPKLDINSFWNKTDLTETADYIEEK
jgi:hypothetical protein